MTENEELKKAALQLKAMVICTSIKTHRSCSECVNENDCGKDEYDTDKIFAKSANIIFDALEELESYRAIGTVKDFKNAVEIIRPRKPYKRSFGVFICSLCGEKVGQMVTKTSKTDCMNFCANCGSMIDWSE